MKRVVMNVSQYLYRLLYRVTLAGVFLDFLRRRIQAVSELKAVCAKCWGLRSNLILNGSVGALKLARGL